MLPGSLSPVLHFILPSQTPNIYRGRHLQELPQNKIKINSRGRLQMKMKVVGRSEGKRQRPLSPNELEETYSTSKSPFLSSREMELKLDNKVLNEI